MPSEKARHQNKREKDQAARRRRYGRSGHPDIDTARRTRSTAHLEPATADAERTILVLAAIELAPLPVLVHGSLLTTQPQKQHCTTHPMAEPQPPPPPPPPAPPPLPTAATTLVVVGQNKQQQSLPPLYKWDESAPQPSTEVLQLWTEVGNGIDKSQTGMFLFGRRKKESFLLNCSICSFVQYDALCVCRVCGW